MEYCEGGELLDRVLQEGAFSESKVVKIMNKLFSAMSYIHSKGIAHRDIKPENILFTNNNTDVKLIDFGLSKVLGTRYEL
jgi:calcium-dependent protein kinase